MANEDRTNILKNPSTWTLILTALSAFGIYNLTPEEISAIATSIGGLVGTIATLLFMFKGK